MKRIATLLICVCFLPWQNGANKHDVCPEFEFVGNLYAHFLSVGTQTDDGLCTVEWDDGTLGTMTANELQSLNLYKEVEVSSGLTNRVAHINYVVDVPDPSGTWWGLTVAFEEERSLNYDFTRVAYWTWLKHPQGWVWTPFWRSGGQYFALFPSERAVQVIAHCPVIEVSANEPLTPAFQTTGAASLTRSGLIVCETTGEGLPWGYIASYQTLADEEWPAEEFTVSVQIEAEYREGVLYTISLPQEIEIVTLTAQPEETTMTETSGWDNGWMSGLAALPVATSAEGILYTILPELGPVRLVIE